MVKLLKTGSSKASYGPTEMQKTQGRDIFLSKTHIFSFDLF